MPITSSNKKMDKTENTKQIMIWFKIYDLMYMYADETQKKDFDALVDSVDIFYAADKDSYQSALERAYEDQVKIMPEGIDNTEDAEAHIKADIVLNCEKIGVEWDPLDEVNLDIEIIGPERVKAELLGGQVNNAPMNFNQMTHNVSEATPEDFDKLPGRVGEQLKGLLGAIEEVHETAGQIYAQYVDKCLEMDIDKEQAKSEAAEYMKGQIPAAEFVAPVAILDNLKDI